MKCEDLMHRDLQWVPSNASVHDVAKIMRDRSMGFLLVFGPSPGQLAGVVTDRDLATRACSLDKRPTEVHVIDIATTNVEICGEAEHLGDAEARMRDLQLSRLVVVNASGQPVGILSLTDIVLHDRGGRALKTARAVLSREAEGPHTPLEQIKLTPSTPEDEDAASRQPSVTIGRGHPGSMKEFPT